MKNRRLVLHVDDDQALLRIVSRGLATRGYEVVSISNPAETLDKIIDTGARVVLLDIDMPMTGCQGFDTPILNGLDLLKKIKAQDGGIQVVMLTGVVTMSTVLRSLRYGAEACVFKPISDYDLLDTTLNDVFGKIDRWWRTLDELKQLQRESTESSHQDDGIPKQSEPRNSEQTTIS